MGLIKRGDIIHISDLAALQAAADAAPIPDGKPFRFFPPIVLCRTRSDRTRFFWVDCREYPGVIMVLRTDQTAWQLNGPFDQVASWLPFPMLFVANDAALRAAPVTLGGLAFQDDNQHVFLGTTFNGVSVWRFYSDISDGYSSDPHYRHGAAVRREIDRLWFQMTRPGSKLVRQGATDPPIHSPWGDLGSGTAYQSISGPSPIPPLNSEPFVIDIGTSVDIRFGPRTTSVFGFFVIDGSPTGRQLGYPTFAPILNPPLNNPLPLQPAHDALRDLSALVPNGLGAPNPRLRLRGGVVNGTQLQADGVWKIRIKNLPHDASLSGTVSISIPALSFTPPPAVTGDTQFITSQTGWSRTGGSQSLGNWVATYQLAGKCNNQQISLQWTYNDPFGGGPTSTFFVTWGIDIRLDPASLDGPYPGISAPNGPARAQSLDGLSSADGSTPSIAADWYVDPFNDGHLGWQDWFALSAVADAPVIWLGVPAPAAQYHAGPTPAFPVPDPSDKRIYYNYFSGFPNAGLGVSQFFPPRWPARRDTDPAWNVVPNVSPFNGALIKRVRVSRLGIVKTADRLPLSVLITGGPGPSLATAKIDAGQYETMLYPQPPWLITDNHPLVYQCSERVEVYADYYLPGLNSWSRFLSGQTFDSDPGFLNDAAVPLSAHHYNDLLWTLGQYS